MGFRYSVPMYIFLHVKGKTTKLLEDNIRGHLHKLREGLHFNTLKKD